MEESSGNSALEMGKGDAGRKTWEGCRWKQGTQHRRPGGMTPVVQQTGVSRPGDAENVHLEELVGPGSSGDGTTAWSGGGGRARNRLGHPGGVARLEQVQTSPGDAGVELLSYRGTVETT